MLTKQSIKEVVTKEVFSVHENQILSDVAKIFRESMVHHVPVVRETKVVGIISTQDLFKLIFNIDSTDEKMLGVLHIRHPFCQERFKLENEECNASWPF